MDFIESEMARRAPGQSALSTSRKEPDAPVLVVLFLILLAAYGWVFASFARQYWKLKRRSGK